VIGFGVEPQRWVRKEVAHSVQLQRSVEKDPEGWYSQNWQCGIRGVVAGVSCGVQSFIVWWPHLFEYRLTYCKDASKLEMDCTFVSSRSQLYSVILKALDSIKESTMFRWH
jgi:hypothetical protein